VLTADRNFCEIQTPLPTQQQASVIVISMIVVLLFRLFVARAREIVRCDTAVRRVGPNGSELTIFHANRPHLTSRLPRAACQRQTMSINVMSSCHLFSDKSYQRNIVDIFSIDIADRAAW